MNTNIENFVSSFSRCVCEINDTREAKDVQDEVKDYFLDYPIKETLYGHEGRVWILLGTKNKGEPEALQIAQAEDIYDEIYKNVRRMYNCQYHERDDGTKETALKYDLDIIQNPNSICSGEDSYMYNSSEAKSKIACFYRYLKKSYDCLRFYEVVIDKYLGPIGELSEMEKDMCELSKDYYCEAKLMIDTNAKWWNMYNSGVGKRFYYLLRKRKEIEPNK